MKTVKELLNDAERAYNRLAQVRKEASETIDEIGNDSRFNSDYRHAKRMDAIDHFKTERMNTVYRLNDIKTKIRTAAIADTPQLDAKRIDPNLITLLQIKGLTPSDFEAIAKQYSRTDGSDFTNQRAIAGAAKEQGFVIRNMKTPEEKAQAAEAYLEAMKTLIREAPDRMDSPLPMLDRDFRTESFRTKAFKAQDPLSNDEIICTLPQIESVIERESRAALEASKDSESAFIKGFAPEIKTGMVDPGDYPALAEAAAKLDEIKLPEKRQRILDGLASAIGEARLKAEEPLTAEELKLASDKTGGYDSALANELKVFADLFAPEGMQFSTEAGTALVKPTAGRESKVFWASLVRDAETRTAAEALAKTKAADAASISDYSANRLANAERAEQERYE